MNLDAGRPDRPFPWEGRVQETFARALVAEGWTIERFAHTGRREHGVDVVASAPNRILGAEVKGAPSEDYVDEKRAGETKRAGTTASQTKAWFAKALLTAVQTAQSEPGWESLLVLPDTAANRRLTSSTEQVLARAGVHVVLVTSDGALTSSTWSA